MSSKSCHLLPSLPAMNRVLLTLALLLVASAAAHRLQQSTSPEAAAAMEATAAGGVPTSGDKMSSANGSEPPRRFHAIFQGSSAAAAAMAELKSSPESLEKMLAGSSSNSRSKAVADNSTNDNGGNNQRNRTRQCREGCLGKRSIKDILCTQQRECAMCWDVCNRNHQIRKENELAHRLLLSLSRMIRNESVVTADIEWTTPEELLEHQPHPGVPSPLAASENVERLSRIARDGSSSNGTSSTAAVSKIIQALSQASSLMGPELKTVTSSSSSAEQSFHQCLVSWEISGGGLTGNLLTETAKVELSLWPNTKYHVHVTCRNKETDQLIRSAPLLIDTSDALVVSLHGTTTTTTSTTTTTTTTTTTSRPLAINSVIEEIEVVQETAAFDSASDDAGAEADSYSSANSYQTKSKAAANNSPSGHNLWPMYSSAVDLPGNSKEVLILGVFVALLAFVLIVLTVVILIRRKHDQIEDRELLIESEVLPKILHV